MDVVVGGDGQCDSPGFTAKNLCYFLMEVTSSYILECVVLDKRHVGMSSTNMEKEALRNALNRLSAVVKVVEVATDASASIKKMMGKYMSTGYFGGIPLSSKHFQSTIQLGAICATAFYALTFIGILFM